MKTIIFLTTLVGLPGLTLAAPSSDLAAAGAVRLGRQIFDGTITPDDLSLRSFDGVKGSPTDQVTWCNAMEMALALTRQRRLVTGRCPGPASSSIYKAVEFDAYHADDPDRPLLRELASLCPRELAATLARLRVVPRSLQPICAELDAREDCRAGIRSRIAAAPVHLDPATLRRLFNEATVLVVHMRPLDLAALRRTKRNGGPLGDRVQRYILKHLDNVAATTAMRVGRGRPGPKRVVAAVDEPGMLDMR